jgi:hypothetical protein
MKIAMYIHITFPKAQTPYMLIAKFDRSQVLSQSIDDDKLGLANKMRIQHPGFNSLNFLSSEKAAVAMRSKRIYGTCQINLRII